MGQETYSIIVGGAALFDHRLRPSLPHCTGQPDSDLCAGPSLVHKFAPELVVYKTQKEHNQIGRPAAQFDADVPLRFWISLRFALLSCGAAPPVFFPAYAPPSFGTGQQ